VAELSRGVAETLDLAVYRIAAVTRLEVSCDGRKVRGGQLAVGERMKQTMGRTAIHGQRSSG
jgi:hypothetical protein